MSFDVEDIATRARERLTEQSEAAVGLTIPRLIALVPDAKLKLANLIAQDDKLRGRLTTTFEVTSTTSVADLSDALTAAEPLLLDYLNRASVFIEGFDSPLKPLPDRGALSLEAAGRASYTVEDETLVVKGTEGMYDGTVTIRKASCVPSYDRIEKVGLDDRLIDIVAAMAAPPARERSTSKGNSA